jgi:hypothetical protein
MNSAKKKKKEEKIVKRRLGKMPPWGTKGW